MNILNRLFQWFLKLTEVRQDPWDEYDADHRFHKIKTLVDKQGKRTQRKTS